MKSRKILDYLQILTGAGMILGLALVLIELNQNEKLTRVRVINDYYTNMAEAEFSLSDAAARAWQKSIEEPNNLTIAEMRLLDTHTYAPLARWVALYRMHEVGLLDAEEWKSQVDLDGVFFFGTHYSLAWWDLYGSNMPEKYLPKELKEYIDNSLQTKNYPLVEKDYEALLENINRRMKAHDLKSTPKKE